MSAISSCSSLNEAPIGEKKLLSSNLNGSCNARENSTNLSQQIGMVEITAKKNDSKTHSPGSTTENALPVLHQRTDDELTSLTWLHDSNLLFGTGLSQMKVINPSVKHVVTGLNGVISGVTSLPHSPKMEEMKLKSVEVDASPEIESPPSELSEEPCDSNEKEEQIIESPQSVSPDQDPVPYNPQIHVKSKPPYSFSSLIFMAIEDSIEKALPVKDIYSWVIRHFPYYRGAPTGWKNSVRHNLSLNKCFRKVDKSPTLGKGSLWMVDPAYRPNLLQTLNKTPFPSTTRTDHIYVTNIRSALNRNPLDHLNRLKEGTPSIPKENSDIPRQFINRQVYENVQSSGETYGRISPSNSFANDSYFSLELQERPMLLKQVHKDDVDAAAAMLVLKHGPTILQDNPHFAYKTTESQGTSIANGSRSGRKRKQFHTELQDPNNVMSSCTTLDHCYVSATDDGIDVDKYVKKQKISTKRNAEPSSSMNIEQAKEEWLENNKNQVPLYEANALLKLASIATSLASTDIHQKMTYFNSSISDSDVLPSDSVRLNECNSEEISQSSKVTTSSPQKLHSRKKKNLHPVKRILNNDIKKLSNNNSCSILNKNNLGHLDYRI